MATKSHGGLVCCCFEATGGLRRRLFGAPKASGGPAPVAYRRPGDEWPLSAPEVASCAVLRVAPKPARRRRCTDDAAITYAIAPGTGDVPERRAGLRGAGGKTRGEALGSSASRAPTPAWDRTTRELSQGRHGP